MNNRLSLQDIAGLLATKTGRTRKDSEQFLREFITLLSEGVFAERIVKVRGLGTFKVFEVEDRESIHVNTGERFVIPGHFKFGFTPDKELKELVNKPFSFFDTTEIEEDVVFPEETIKEKEEEEAETVYEVYEDKEEKAEEQEVAVAEPPQEEEVHLPIQPPEKAKKKNRFWSLFIIILVVLAVALGFYYYSSVFGVSPVAKEPVPVEETPAIPETPAEDILAGKDSIATSVQEEVVPEEIEEEPEILAYETIEAGSRLTLISLEYYGSKIFWVYIYEYNKQQIADPNNIPIGTKLAIPAPRIYGIDVKDKASVERASILQTEIIEGSLAHSDK